ncbi:hypothetical protein BX661DRAFT_97008 [Kickxella alabastrina]|uniref:uncharacterized protein n=1 Tax=Kickxella alabastrina TaxID=61397 RepID=UPI0022204AC8|nr:uncharacterized protein BX661DRAFT_97008 [Kickxella alabastrina]KAI7830079.1 hypothetical protein BX661DRAFT_97008 [Kickxella alabastrina]
MIKKFSLAENFFSFPPLTDFFFKFRLEKIHKPRFWARFAFFFFFLLRNTFWKNRYFLYIISPLYIINHFSKLYTQNSKKNKHLVYIFFVHLLQRLWGKSPDTGQKVPPVIRQRK